MFQKLVKRRYSVLNDGVDEDSSHLSSIEENVVRYVAGYVCRKVRKDLEKSKEKNEDAMILFFFELSEDEERRTEQWTNELDRGGLWHVSDLAYTLFYSMEQVVCIHVQPALMVQQMDECWKELMVNAIMEDDVLFQWTMFGTDVEELIGITLEV